MEKFFNKLKENIAESSPELKAKAAKLAEKSKELASDVAEKAQPMLSKAQSATEEFVEKAKPVVKGAADSVTSYAQENAPIVKQQAKKALEDAYAHHKALKEKAANDKEAYKHYVEQMYDLAIPSSDESFIDAKFIHFDRHLNFMCVSGEVLDTHKREAIDVQASSSMYASSSHKPFYSAGYSSMSVSSSSHFSATSSTVHEFWLKLPNGLEKPVYVSGDSVPLRKDQNISLLYACSDQSDEGRLIAIYNHSAQSLFQIIPTGRINQIYGIDVREPGLFNKKKIEAEQSRMMSELNKRIQDLGVWAARWGNVSSQLAMEGS